MKVTRHTCCSFSTRCEFWLGLLTLMLPLLGVHDVAWGQGEDLGELERAPFESLFRQLDFAPNNSRRVTHVRVVFKDYPDLAPLAVRRNPDFLLDEQIVDEHRLRIFEAGLHRAMIRPSNHFSLGGVGSVPLGELVVTTNVDQFKVYIDVQFTLGGPFADSDRRFQSWILARAVDDVYFNHTREHIREDYFTGMSGERVVPIQRKQ